MIGEIPIAKDSLLMIRYGAANRDPKMFEHPDTFNIDRTNASRHLSFGSGPHTCVGNLLARAELRIAVANMLKKTREIRLKDGEASVSWLTQFIVYGPNRLELAFSPA
jgi:cytochrome P450